MLQCTTLIFIKSEFLAILEIINEQPWRWTLPFPMDELFLSSQAEFMPASVMPPPHQNVTNAYLCPHDALPLKLPKALAFSQKCVLSSWHSLLRQKRCCSQLWSSQSSPWIQTLFCMSVPGTCRKAAVIPKKSGWCCWKSWWAECLLPGDMLVEGCSVLCSHVVFNSLS